MSAIGATFLTTAPSVRCLGTPLCSSGFRGTFVRKSTNNGHRLLKTEMQAVLHKDRRHLHSWATGTCSQTSSRKSSQKFNLGPHIQGIWEDLFCKCHKFRSGLSPPPRCAIQALGFTRPKWSEEVVPTVGFNVRNVRKGNITLKIWDIAGASRLLAGSGSSTLTRYPTGQPKFRSTWERYCSGVDVVIFIIDSHDVCAWFHQYLASVISHIRFRRKSSIQHDSSCISYCHIKH